MRGFFHLGPCIDLGMKNSIARARRLRRDMTPPERLFWGCVRDRAFHDLKFRRQVPIGCYVADFLCERHNLVVELDGDTHAFQVDYDRRRDMYFANVGYRVLRFTNRDVLQNIEGVLTVIAEACGK